MIFAGVDIHGRQFVQAAMLSLIFIMSQETGDLTNVRTRRIVFNLTTLGKYMFKPSVER